MGSNDKGIVAPDPAAEALAAALAQAKASKKKWGNKLGKDAGDVLLERQGAEDLKSMGALMTLIPGGQGFALVLIPIHLAEGEPVAAALYMFPGGNALRNSLRIAKVASAGRIVPGGSAGGFSRLRSVGGLVAGEVSPIAVHNVNTPWYRLRTPVYEPGRIHLAEGLSQAEKLRTMLHEGQHAYDFVAHPQITYLATHPHIPGSGFARYFLEYRGYAAEGRAGLLAPFQSFNEIQMIEFGRDTFLFGGGTTGAIYANVKKD